jgi:hypothetical protein
MAEQTAPDTTSSAAGPPGGGNPLTAHPMTSSLIGLLVLATIVIPLVVPIYARITPKVGDFPFFYFFLLAFMPVVALVLWVVTLLQRRLGTSQGGQS